MGCEPQPEYLKVLRDEDLAEFVELKNMFTSEDYNFFGQNPFFEFLQIIKEFSIRNNDDDARRCAVCGLCWLKSSLGVNYNHINYLTGQPKLTINRELTNLNYTPTQFSDEIIIRIPFLQGNLRELRLWTFRKTPDSSPSVIQPHQRQKISQSPKPHLKRSMIFEKTWSYEDFDLSNIDAAADPTNSCDDFYADAFVIPLGEWKMDSPSSITPNLDQF